MSSKDRSAILEGRLAAGNEKNGIEPEMFQRIPGEDEVAVMHRVERAAVDAQPQSPGTRGGSWSGFPLHASTT